MIELREIINPDNSELWSEIDIYEDGIHLTSITRDSLFEDLQDLLYELGIDFRAFDINEELIASYEFIEDTYNNEDELIVPLKDLDIEEL